MFHQGQDILLMKGLLSLVTIDKGITNTVAWEPFISRVQCQLMVVLALESSHAFVVLSLNWDVNTIQHARGLDESTFWIVIVMRAYDTFLFRITIDMSHFVAMASEFLNGRELRCLGIFLRLQDVFGRLASLCRGFAPYNFLLVPWKRGMMLIILVLTVDQ